MIDCARNPENGDVWIEVGQIDKVTQKLFEIITKRMLKMDKMDPKEMADLFMKILFVNKKLTVIMAFASRLDEKQFEEAVWELLMLPPDNKKDSNPDGGDSEEEPPTQFSA